MLFVPHLPTGQVQLTRTVTNFIMGNWKCQILLVVVSGRFQVSSTTCTRHYIQMNSVFLMNQNHLGTIPVSLLTSEPVANAHTARPVQHDPARYLIQAPATISLRVIHLNITRSLHLVRIPARQAWVMRCQLFNGTAPDHS